jgi:hypothetical protein
MNLKVRPGRPCDRKYIWQSSTRQEIAIRKLHFTAIHKCAMADKVMNIHDD